MLSTLARSSRRAMRAAVARSRVAAPVTSSSSTGVAPTPVGAGHQWRWNSTAAIAAAAAVGAVGVTAASCEDKKTKKKKKKVKGCPKMYYRMLGNTGLQVSVLAYGFWATFGVKDDLHKQEGVDMAKDCLRVAREAGINLFDNAEAYGNPNGEAEKIMGEALAQLREEDPVAWRRSDIVITTKLFWGGKGRNENGLSSKHVREGLDASLKRLQLDYVDLVFCHRPDPLTPTETVVRAMTDAVRSGKATAWGTSEWSAQQITEAVWIAKSQGLEPPQFEQPQYNMMHRERFEQEYRPLFNAPYNMGTTIWSPLASGLLTGKYNKTIPDGSRLATPGYEWLVARLKQWKETGEIEKVRELTDYAAKNFECSVAQLALAWCIKNQNVSSVLLGATKVHQLEENLAAVEVARRMTAEHMKDIDSILDNTPEAYSGYVNGRTRWRGITSYEGEYEA